MKIVVIIMVKFLNSSRKCDCLELSLTTEKKQKGYISIKKLYPFIANKAIRALILFASFYFCEMGSFALAVIKAMYGSILNTKKRVENRVFKIYATIRSFYATKTSTAVLLIFNC